MFSQRSDQETIDRLSILHVLESYGQAIPKERLVSFLIENEILKYFDLHQLIANLTESQLIETRVAEESLAYQLTENGRISLAFFRDRMPLDLQNTLSDLVKALPVPKSSHNAVVAAHQELENGSYDVTLELYENQQRLMGVTLNVVSPQQARQIEQRWEEDAEYLYGDIIQLLIKEPPNRR